MTKLGEATAQAIINANIDSINISEWLFNITAEEYAACSSGHQSAAQGQLPSGKRVSMNVENVAGYFMVQHYIETISEKDRVLTVSPNTTLWLDDVNYVILQITWELKLDKIDDNTCLLTCKVISETENEQFIQATHELTKDIDPQETPFQLHINEETPLFAKDIETKALAGVFTMEEV
ncbi:hypothetical protein [Flammeovirga sp. SJP92]|uniref:hypothetical protein n=1 Tax=Flammeovirga sp. SJP92 TaxID=1775430 RepID=UPI0007882FE2|nr:hypothetical protein [Flammeovirga sp. SJP92]KXX66822.1 hypothetical protein AVL50_30280 [Flammeovirga sp. SJP92]